MPPRPSSPAIRYRPANTVPGRNRPSSTLLEELRCGAEGPAGMSAVSAELRSKRAVHQEQNVPPALSRPHDGHFTVAAMDHLFWQRRLACRNTGLEST